MTTRQFSLARIGLIILLLGIMLSVATAAPSVLPPGQLSEDVRLGPLKDLNGYFPFTPAKTPDEWSRRAERVRRQMLVALGLWPMPTKTPLNTVIHGRVELDDYTVEKVYFESVPGFFVAGSLFRRKVTGRTPRCFVRMAIGPTGGSMTKALMACGRKSLPARSGSRRADAACCRRGAWNSPAWVVLSSSMT